MFCEIADLANKRIAQPTLLTFCRMPMALRLRSRAKAQPGPYTHHDGRDAGKRCEDRVAISATHSSQYATGNAVLARPAVPHAAREKTRGLGTHLRFRCGFTYAWRHSMQPRIHRMRTSCPPPSILLFLLRPSQSRYAELDCGGHLFSQHGPIYFSNRVRGQQIHNVERHWYINAR